MNAETAGHVGTLQLKQFHMGFIDMWHHPKYYKELRKLRNKLDQAISARETADDARATGPGLKQQASSSKLRYTPTGILLGVDLGDKPQAPSDSNNKPQASSDKQQASSSKPQASSSKI